MLRLWRESNSEEIYYKSFNRKIFFWTLWARVATTSWSLERNQRNGGFYASQVTGKPHSRALPLCLIRPRTHPWEGTDSKIQ